MPKNYKLIALDAQMAALRARRKLLLNEAILEGLRGRALGPGRSRRVVNAITDLSLAKKLQAALEENARLRQRLMGLESVDAHWRAAQQDVEKIGNERNALAERLAAAELEYSRAVGDLERVHSAELDRRTNLAAEAERRRCADYLEAVLAKAPELAHDELYPGAISRQLMERAAIYMREGKPGPVEPATS